MSTLENDTELNKKLEESFDEINIADTTDDVLELTFNELIEGINAKYFEFLNKLSVKFKDHEKLSKSIQFDIQYLQEKCEKNSLACLVTITDNFLYCFEQVKDKNSDFFIYQKEQFVRKSGKTVKNKISKIGNKTLFKDILNNLKRDTIVSTCNDLIDIMKLLIYEEDSIYRFHDDYLEFIDENFKNNKNYTKINIVVENIDSIIGSIEEDLIEEEEYEKEVSKKEEMKKGKKKASKKDNNMGADFIKGIEDTKIAQMAKSISEKINIDDYPILTDPMKLFSSLSNPEEGLGSIGGLMDVVMKEVQSSFKSTDTNENDLVNEAQNIMGKLSGTNLDPMNIMKNMNMDKFADIFNKK